MLSIVLDSISEDIQQYNDANKPLNDAKVLASPQEIRDLTVEMPFILPHLIVLDLSPEIQL